VIVARTRSELANALESLRASGPVALVPTMGYLHEGHLTLVDSAKGLARHVVVSIFVNPLQFGPSEDFARYPRDEARDLVMLEERGVALAFLPDVQEMYPRGTPAMTVSAGAMGEALCGRYRPGHFGGVLTVVAKLFGLFRPEVAVFGRKDLQQWVLIRRMTEDLELRVDVRVAPTVREADGLAMSSRNVYLSPEERAQAVGLIRALEAGRDAFAQGERSAWRILRSMRHTLDAYPLVQVQYLELVDRDSLGLVESADERTVAAVAAFLGRTRLIDNADLAEGAA
jgi:pantoate--beta-alanine ligase